MLINELLNEGGWDSTVTQGTVIKPEIATRAILLIKKLISDFNSYTSTKGMPPVKVGYPTGSSAYHDIDSQEDPDKIYGDVDLQIVAPYNPDLTSQTQVTRYWNDMVDEYISNANLQYVHSDSSSGHPIVRIGPEQWIQVDFMWHTDKTAEWGRYRTTPERGVKGLLNGNMFSVLGQMLNMSIQHAGVQLKTIDGKQVPFSKRKGVELVTITTDPRTFVRDILVYLYKDIVGEDQIQMIQIDPLLKKYQGVATNNVKISALVNAVKGLAKSFEINRMYGQGALDKYTDENDFLKTFIDTYTKKAQAEMSSNKRDKAETPEAKERAAHELEVIQQGLKMVQSLFAM